MKGAFRLFRVAGINVYLHWSWLLFAFIIISSRTGGKGSELGLPFQREVFWNVLEYLALFGIVLMHEFGHSLACRQTGGIADQIVLWPLGGIAFVRPPPRPGALLWSIAAGPLVNVVLIPVLAALAILVGNMGNAAVYEFVKDVAKVNFGLLIFNILPVYPLDGGQILRALLWFVLGRHRSLLVACAIGVLGGIGFVVLAIFMQSIWTGVIAAFMIMQCARGFQEARVLSRLDAAPRHEEFSCPSCGAAPLEGAYWTCGQCGQRFDTFEHGGRCPGCGTAFTVTSCPECHQQNPISNWLRAKPGV